MTSFIVPAGAGEDAVFDDARLHLAAAAHLARFKGLSREHADSDLRAFLSWCAGRDIEPLRAQRAQLELYVRWMQETRRYKPSPGAPQCFAGSTAPPSSTGSCATPAKYVRRPTVPPESPTLDLTHLQFEAMLTAARESANRFDFALVAMLGLLGLRIFEATGTDATDLGEEHGHRVLRVVGKGTKVVLVPLPPAVGRAVDRAVDGTHAPRCDDRARKNLDRHPNYILAANMASGT